MSTRLSSMASRLLLISALLATGCGPEETLDPERYPLIPLPADADPKDGEFFLTGETRIVLSHPDDAEVRGVVERWAAPLREA